MKKTVLLVAAAVLIAAAGVATAADSNTVTVSANVSGTCKFTSATSTLAFGALDPSSAADGAATVNVNFWCTKGVTATLTDDDGLYETGANANRMRHATDLTAFIPYTFTYSASSLLGDGPGTPRTLTIDGAIANANYINALAGDYSDTVVVSINP